MQAHRAILNEDPSLQGIASKLKCDAENNFVEERQTEEISKNIKNYFYLITPSLALFDPFFFGIQLGEGLS